MNCIGAAIADLSKLFSQKISYKKKRSLGNNIVLILSQRKALNRPRRLKTVKLSKPPHETRILHARHVNPSVRSAAVRLIRIICLKVYKEPSPRRDLRIGCQQA